MFRWLIWGSGAALLTLIVYLAIRPRPVLVDIATVQYGPLQVTVEEDGKTRIRERYIVSAPLAGRLLRVTLDVGDPVIAEHTVLAVMEATEPELLDPRAIAQAKSRVGAAERRLAAAKAELVRLEAMLQFAEKEMGRVRALVSQNAASEREFSERELEFRQRTEEVRAAGYSVDIAEYELQLERDALLLTDPDQNRPGDMELKIKAPIHGRVLRIYQESAAVLEAGAPLMEIGDPMDLEVVADILSRDAVMMSPGNPVRLQHWGGERPLLGTVRLVEPSGFTKLSALGVEEQRVNVIIDLTEAADQRPQLGDGFRVDCQIVVWESSHVLRVPTSALFRLDEGWHVFTVIDSVAQSTPVEIGKNNGTWAEVISGLGAGDRVITHPGDAIDQGVRVSERT